MAQFDGHPVDNEIIRAVFKHIGPPQTGPPQTGAPQTGAPQTGAPQTGLLIGIQTIDRDGFLGEGQAIFAGTEADLQDLVALCAGLFDKGFCLQAPNWLRALAGMPPDAEYGLTAEGGEAEEGPSDAR